MNTSVYLVTALIVGDDPCSPTVLGVYDTCDLAVQRAKEFFQTQSMSYRNGVFSTKLSFGVTGQEDWTTTTKKQQEPFAMRVLAETVDQEHATENNAVTVAINAVLLNSTYHTDIPLLQDHHHSKESAAMSKGSKVGPPPSEKLHIIMSVIPHDDYGERDSTLLGIFTDKNLALQVAREDFKTECRNDYDDVQDNTESVGDFSGNLFNVEECEYGSAIAVVTMNQDVYLEMDFQIMGSGIYMNPGIECEESSIILPCATCKEAKSSVEYRKQDWIEKDNTNRCCRACFAKVPMLCGTCKLEKTPSCFHENQWDMKTSKCKECVEEESMRVCSACQIRHPLRKYRNGEYYKSDTERQCTACKKKKAPMPGQKRAVVDSPNPTETKRAKAHTRVTPTKCCANCQTEKSKNSFSKNQWRKGGSARCQTCVSEIKTPTVDPTKEC